MTQIGGIDMKGIIGTSMQGREYYKRPDKVKCNCKTCWHCVLKDKDNDSIFCSKYREWKHGNEYRNRRVCRWFFTFPDKKHGSTCRVNDTVIRFLNPKLHFHLYQRKSANDTWEYIGKIYADSEANAVNKLLTGKQYANVINRNYEHKAEVHGEDIERIETWGENNIPKIIWKKVD